MPRHKIRGSPTYMISVRRYTGQTDGRTSYDGITRPWCG